MKKKLILTALILVPAVWMSGRTTLDVRGVTYNVDTTFHAKVGPGTTQTSLKLSGTSNPLLVHYLTIDRTTPGVSIRAVCATNKVAGTARTSTMASSNTKPGVDYFAGCNADFFTTSGNATNGSSKVGTPTTSCTVEREIYKTSNSNYQFSVDVDGVARVCRLNYYTGTATIGEKVTLFKGVNVMSPANGITLYTPRFWGTANQNDYAGECNQVTARLVAGDEFTAGGKFRLEVTSEPTTDGDLAIPSDGFVIHGRGTSKTGCNTGALNFVGALHKGDIVEFDNIILTPEGERIVPRTIVSGNPKNVGGGLTLDTEGERNDASARHPRTCVGVNEDGTKMIMMVIDGRIGASVGVTTSMLADVMRFAGAYEAVNVDGGGSSTLYTHALGVRNNCSDGSERAVGNAIFAVLEAPEDDEVAEIGFADWTKTVPYLGEYRPLIYAYNKYGKLIDTDYRGFTLSCDEALGTVSEDGLGLIAGGSGTHRLTATTPDGISACVVVTVSKDSPIEATLPSVLLNATREWDVQLHSIVDNDRMVVSPRAFQWTSSDTEVATVTADGTVKGVADGKCTVTGVRGAMTIPVEVTVEVPKDIYHHIDPTPSAENWATSKTSLNIENFEVNENHTFGIDYKLTSTRGPKITLTRKIAMWSHPMAVNIGLNPGNSTVSSMTLTLKAQNDTRTVATTLSGISAEPGEYVFPLKDMMNTDDIAVYPVEFTSAAFSVGGSTSTPYHLDITGIRAQYSPDSVDAIDLRADRPEGLPFAIAGELTIRFATGVTNATVTDLNGRVVAVTADAGTLAVPAHGLYIVGAVLDGTLHTAKVVL